MNVLTIRVDPVVHPDYPCTALLIDGHDQIGRGELIGFDPGALFDSGALLPHDPPRRVGLYRCGACGEPGCGTAAPIIRQDGNRIVWEDFQDFVGVFVDALVEDEEDYEDGDLWGGRPLDIPDFTFDAAQYNAAVASATADRSWETRTRRLARMLQHQLEQDAAQWLPAGWSIHWLAGQGTPETFHLALHKPQGQIVIAITVDLQRPDEQLVERAVHTLISSSPAEWSIVFENNGPAADL